MAGDAFNKVFEGAFSRDDEDESDRVGTQLANTVGYAPTGIADVLKKIQARNGSRQDRNGMFASHPAIKDRISNNEKLDQVPEADMPRRRGRRATSSTSRSKPSPITEITMDVEGAAGLAGGDKKKEDDKKAEAAKKEEPKKQGGFGSALGSITGTKQQTTTQQASSAGARGGIPDRDATGGPNKNALAVKFSAAELEAFKKGIA